MYQSPRIRRLHNDLAALERLRSESSVFRFSTQGDPPHHYLISFKGKSLWRDRGKVKPLAEHRVEIKLGASYPRTIPELRWMTPIYHPNISEIGMVCLGGYGTNWVPSIQLDELCVMLWDMARYHNYDIRSPYNREAALWVASQTNFLFPMDGRPLRDLRAALGRVGPPASAAGRESAAGAPGLDSQKQQPLGSSQPLLTGQLSRVRQFVARYSQVFGGSEPEADPAHSIAQNPQPSADRAASSGAGASIAARPDVDNPDDLIILGVSQSAEATSRARPCAGDEILFIE